ncbi:AI-2E family transporter [Geobacter sp.]|uniref:AI-2E family transporter n=1 Tax=Geobacter sp. TaxID=46610 RepID=UPI002618598E|nr:AI-2E family transporter [Geobacter sp.]
MRPREAAHVAWFLAGIFGVILLAGHFARHSLSALLTALVIAYLLNPAMKFLERKGLGRLPAIAVLYLCLGVLLLFSLFALIPYLGHQLEAFPRAVPRYLQNLQGVLDAWKGRLAPYYGSEEGSWLIARAGESLRKLAQDVSGQGYQQLKRALFGLFNLILAPILVFFMLCYKEFVKDLILRFIPHRERPSFRQVGGRVKGALERFVVAQFIDCLLVGALSAAALSVLGVEFALLNGLVAGFASVVPFVGVIVAVIPPTLIGYAETGDLLIIPKVCAAYFVIYVIIEGNLIKPLLMRGTLRLNPLAVIFALMAMGELLGFWGVVLAVPVAAVVKICAGELRGYLDERNANDA